MRQAIVTIAALLLATAILMAGNGLQITLLPLRANLEGFSLNQIGAMLSVYFFGYMVGCRITPILVRNVGHVRAFTALASIASATALIHALLLKPEAWIVLRGVTGLCLAGVTMIIESWINEKATNRNRGQVLSVYRIIDLGASIAGQALLTLADPFAFSLFALASILISLSLVPVALTTSPVPRPIPTAHLDLRKLMAVSPLAVGGVLTVGLANSAFWGMGPVFVQAQGYAVSIVALFMSAVIGGGALAQWPVGWLSDRFDRRKVIIVVTALAAISGLALSGVGASSQLSLLAAGMAFGAFAMPLWGLCAAHANDHCEADEYVETSAGLLLVFAIGAVVGPLVVTPLMNIFGVGSMFYYTAAVHASLLLFGLYRLPKRAAVAPEEKEHYIDVPRTTPAVFELDPRAPEDLHPDDWDEEEQEPPNRPAD